jgi:hypothetical protein
MVQSHWLIHSADGRARIPMQGAHSSLRFVSETCTLQNRRSVPWPAVSVTMGTSTQHARCCPSQNCFSSACLSCHAAVIFPRMSDVTELTVWTASAGNVAVRALALSSLAILQSITIYNYSKPRVAAASSRGAGRGSISFVTSSKST